MYGLKKLERYLRVNLLGPGPRFIKKKRIYRAAVTEVEKHCFRASHSGEFCIRGDGLCVRVMWSWLTAYGRDPKRTKRR